MAMNQPSCDVLIIGSGAAGLSLALQLAEHAQVIIVSKERNNEGATYYAQGGIAAVFDENDSVEAHVNDTQKAGDYICDPEIVRFIAEKSKASVQWLIDNGVFFDREQTESEQPPRYHLTREGGHSHRRILHTADSTGRAIQGSLQQRAHDHPNITMLECYNALDLITQPSEADTLEADATQAGHKEVGNKNVGNKTAGNKTVVGAYLWNRQQQVVESFRSKCVVLATGGASKVYQYTSNPDISSGDGIAMAWRAGCRVANLEFNQFHPTCLFHPQAKNFLLTEALRGEGAHLVRPDGSRFMFDFDSRGELAPRDIVARSIDFEMKRLGVDCMYLDISHQSAEFIEHHFPMINARLQKLGIDMTQQPIPIVPAAHYTCGGVMVNQQGQTDIPNLYAIGEVSYTGLHGANRMASNSLLECVVFASSAAKAIVDTLPHLSLANQLPCWDQTHQSSSDEEVVIHHNWRELRLLMWDYMGIVRTNKRLERALRRIHLLQQEITEYYQHFRISHYLIELRNLLQVSELMVRCAIARKESRGLHYTLDYPEKLAASGPTILTPPCADRAQDDPSQANL